MSINISAFLLLPFWFRVVVSLAVWILVLWKFFGNYIRYGLSVIPFLLRLLFRLLYWSVEIPVTAIHSKVGSAFLAKLENKMSTVGEHIDCVIGCWYEVWHTTRKIEFKKCLIVYLVCIAIVLVPFYMNVNNEILKVGQILYTKGELDCVNWLEEHKWYDSGNQKEIHKVKQIEQTVEQKEEIKLVVSGVNSSLLVRDIPSTENCTVLDRLQNDDAVVWTGQMVFAEAEGDHVEPWVRVITQNNVEGWSRLYYLHPEQYADEVYFAGKE